MRANHFGGKINSARWQSRKAEFTMLSQTYRTLTPLQQDAWEAIAPDYPAENRFGQVYIPSGYQVYMTLNGTLQAARLPILTVPLMPEVLFQPGAVTLDINPGGFLRVSWTNNLGVDDYINVYASGPRSQGATLKEGNFALMTTVAAAPPPNEVLISAEYIARYGVAPSGAKLWTKVEAIKSTTGQSGNIEVDDFINP